MNCIYCGTNLVESSNFCHGCGKQVDKPIPRQEGTSREKDKTRPFKPIRQEKVNHNPWQQTTVPMLPVQQGTEKQPTQKNVQIQPIQQGKANHIIPPEQQEKVQHLDPQRVIPQCPNCGGFKISKKKFYVNPVTGNRNKGGFGCIYLMWFFFGWQVAGGSLVIANQLGGDAVDWALVVFGIIYLGGFVFIYWLQRQQKNTSLKGFDYSCDLCGYNWGWMEGDPIPDITVRPDLIERGVRKLEEEKRRQDEAAAAAWWLEQQRKKNR